MCDYHKEKGAPQKRIGILGGYGSVGVEVAKSLMATTSHKILLGGRNGEKLGLIVEKLGTGVASMVVDVYNQSALGEFCSRCDIVINCTGPSRQVACKVALAALQQGCHYVDPADNSLYNALIEKNEVVKQKGLLFVISAGIIPGILEVLPMYLVNNKLDKAQSLEYYFVSYDRLSFSSAYDIICGFLSEDDAGMVYYEDGRIKKSSFPMKNMCLPQPIGKVDTILTFTDSMKDVVEKCNVSKCHLYTALGGKSTRKALYDIRLSRQEKTESQMASWSNLLVDAMDHDLNDRKAGNMFHLIITGEKGGVYKKLTATLFFKNGFRLMGIIAASTARLIIDGMGHDPGCFLLHKGIHIGKMMELLEESGICVSQSIETL